jgi:hypothetical protein
MTDEQNMSMDQNEFMKRMKAIASDLWGGILPPEEPAADPVNKPAEPVRKEPEKPKTALQSIWKTADETIDWTDALAHDTPTDGLTGMKKWTFYHKHAARVLEGDLEAYTEVLQKANPLGELTEYAEGITLRAPSADRLESCFVCRAELMEKDRKLYLAAMGLRIARDLLACLPAEEVAVTAEENGKTAFKAVYTRQQLLHRNFNFVDPVALSEEFGAEYN